MVDVKEAFTRKLGPLPVWAWGGVIGGGLLVYRMANGGGSGSASSPFVQPVSGGTPLDYDNLAGGGGSGSGSGAAPTPTPATPVLPKPQNPTPVGAQRPRRETPMLAHLRLLGISPANAVRITSGRIPAPAGFYPTPGDPLAPRLPSPLGDTDKGYPVVTVPAESGFRFAAPFAPLSPVGDTTANQPPTLGLPADRLAAITATNDKMAASYREPGPATPRVERPIPGIAPTLPPVLRTQGDTRAIGDSARNVFDPAGLAITARALLRGSLPPTTVGHRVRVPATLTAAAQRIRPTDAG